MCVYGARVYVTHKRATYIIAIIIAEDVDVFDVPVFVWV